MTARTPETAHPLTWGERIDRHSGRLMVLPAVIVLLAFAIFPLIISAYLSLSRFALAPGGFTLKFIGLLNYKKLLTGSQQYHLLGSFGTPGPLQWLLLAAVAALMLWLLLRYFRRGWTVVGTLGRLVTLAVAHDHSLSPKARSSGANGPFCMSASMRKA